MFDLKPPRHTSTLHIPAYFMLANLSGCQGQGGRVPGGGLVAAADQFTGAASTEHWAP